MSIPLRAISQAITEFEFHMSPVLSSSRPHTGVGTCGTRSSTRCARGCFVGESPRAFNGLVDVGDLPVAPATYLVAKDPKPARPADPDGTFGDNAALLAVGVTDRRLLDHEPCRRDTDFERRVVQVARWSPRGPRRRRLEHPAVESNEMATGAEGQPVQVDRGRPPDRPRR